MMGFNPAAVDDQFNVNLSSLQRSGVGAESCNQALVSQATSYHPESYLEPPGTSPFISIQKTLLFF